MSLEKFGGPEALGKVAEDFSQERLQTVFADKTKAEETLAESGAPEYVLDALQTGAKSYIRLIKSFDTEGYLGAYAKHDMYDDFSSNYLLPLRNGLEAVGVECSQAAELSREWYGLEHVLHCSTRLLAKHLPEEELVPFELWKQEYVEPHANGVEGGLAPHKLNDALDYESTYLNSLQWVAYTRSVGLVGLERSITDKNPQLQPYELTAVMDNIKHMAKQRLNDFLEFSNGSHQGVELFAGRAFSFSPQSLVDANAKLSNLAFDTPPRAT